jgi:hypothetical protein
MSLTKERVDNNTEKLLFNNKPASFSGVIVLKDLSKKTWIIIDCSSDDKISKGLNNIAKQLNVKFNPSNLYCKYNEEDLPLKEGQKCNIVADLYLSKNTIYGKINRLNPFLLDSINITDNTLNVPSSPITFSDDTINKIKLVIKEAFSEALKENVKNIEILVEVIKELADVLDKKGQTTIEEHSPIEKTKDVSNDYNDLPDNDLPNDDLSDNDLPNE